MGPSIAMAMMVGIRLDSFELHFLHCRAFNLKRGIATLQTPKGQKQVTSNRVRNIGNRQQHGLNRREKYVWSETWIRSHTIIIRKLSEVPENELLGRYTNWVLS